MLSNLFGGYDTCFLIHQRVGVLMIIGFALHVLYLVGKINWRNPRESIFGPDSLVPNLQDARNLWQRILWFFGLGRPRGWTAGHIGRNSITGRYSGVCRYLQLPG